jgi:anti-sigma B factor antagonist
MTMVAPEDLSVSVRREGTHAMVVVAGELDLHSSAVLCERLSRIRDADVIDLDAGGITFIDSAGLHALLVARKAAMDRGAEFRVVATSERMARVVEITGVGEILPES